MTGNEATGGARSFRFGVVAPLRTDLPAWRDQVRRIADSGFSTLLMPDVQQWQPAPGPTLAVAATLADLRVGTWVYASPLRTPWSTAWEAHSLSVLTEGRFDPAALRAADSLLVLPSDPTAAIEEVLRRREEGGFSYFVVGANAADALAPIVAELTGHLTGKTDAMGEGVDQAARLESLPTLMPLP